MTDPERMLEQRVAMLEARLDSVVFLVHEQTRMLAEHLATAPSLDDWKRARSERKRWWWPW